MQPAKPESDRGYNREQDEESQAPDIEAVLRDGFDVEQGETSRPRNDDPGEILPDDVPDLIDKMDEMFVSGRIDNDAFAGEPIHDDEENIIGSTEDEGDDRDDLTIVDGEPL